MEVADLDIEKAKKMSYESLRRMYKSYLEGQALSRNTVQTMSGDTFYLWNNASQEAFWSAVTSDDFKIDTGEHDNQLNRYRKIVEDTYPGYKKMYIYLSPEGLEASDPEYWCSMSYQDVLGIVENARKRVKLLPDAALLIDNYIETIRRDIVGDEKLAQICAEIYAKHQKALDLIFENRPDKATELAEVIKNWAVEKTDSGDIEVVLENKEPLFL